MRRAHCLLASVALVATLGACGKKGAPKSAGYPGGGSASGSASAPAPEELTPATFTAAQADTRVNVSAVEYRFDLSTTTAVGPDIFFTVTNAGTEQHEMQVRNADEDEVYRIPPFDPGQTRTLAVTLKPGTYTLQCLIVKGVQTHSMLGMISKFTVTSGS